MVFPLRKPWSYVIVSVSFSPSWTRSVTLIFGFSMGCWLRYLALMSVIPLTKSYIFRKRRRIWKLQQKFPQLLRLCEIKCLFTNKPTRNVKNLFVTIKLFVRPSKNKIQCDASQSNSYKLTPEQWFLGNVGFVRYVGQLEALQ